MASLTIVLLIVAFLCFAFAAMQVKSAKIDLVAAGFAFWVLSVLLALWKK